MLEKDDAVKENSILEEQQALKRDLRINRYGKTSLNIYWQKIETSIKNDIIEYVPLGNSR